MHRLDVLELHVTHACNLSCDSCSHYSNHGHKGNLSIAEADRWMALWSDRVTIREFAILGGEPAVHPELPAFVRLVRRHWPNTFVVIKTNGLLLHRHPELPAAIAEVGNSGIVISRHHDSTEYLRRMEEVARLAEAWKRQYHIGIWWTDSYERWTQRYIGFGAAMKPFADKNPRRSWEICPAQNCKQLLEGKIWKCAPLAYLPMQHRRFGLSEDWQPYLNYEPLSPSCSEEELMRFLSRQDEEVCSMCSAEKRHLKIPSPIRGDIGKEIHVASAPIRSKKNSMTRIATQVFRLTGIVREEKPLRESETSGPH